MYPTGRRNGIAMQKDGKNEHTKISTLEFLNLIVIVIACVCLIMVCCVCSFSLTKEWWAGCLLYICIPTLIICVTYLVSLLIKCHIKKAEMRYRFGSILFGRKESVRIK